MPMGISLSTIGLPFQQNVIAQILGGASFFVTLTHTAVPTRAAPGTTATFTRATTETWTNNDGYMVTGVAGEIGFVGARRVRNRIQTTSEDLSNAAWTSLAISATAPSANTVLASAASNNHYLRNAGATSVAGAVWVLQAKITAGTHNFAVIGDDGDAAYHGATFNLATGVVSAQQNSTGSISNLGGGEYLCSVKFTRTNAGATRPCLGVAQNASANIDTVWTPAGTETIIAEEIQLEDVTAQTTQTAGEYVSVGVPSDWQGTELVTNGTFDTATTGWTAYDGGILAVVDGKLTVTNQDAGAGTNGTAYQAIPTVVGARYVCSYSAGVSLTSAYLAIGNAPQDYSIVADTYSSSTTTQRKVEFVAVSTVTYLSFVNYGSALNVATIDNISVKPAYYHGSFVDGVKCFPTDLSGNPIPSTTMLGYQAEGARTNLVVRSNDLDNASWLKNNATVSANAAVASDGTTSLDKIVEAATTSTHTVYQNFVGTSGSYTISVEMKQAERTWGFITEGNSVTASAFFDLANGVVGTVAGTGSPSATITKLANGAYRCKMTFAAGANANCQFGPAAGDGAAAYAGDITKGIYAGMAGFENASFASSYIATTTVAVTRDPDILDYTGGDIPNLKTLSATFRREVGVSSAGHMISLGDTTINNYAVVLMNSATSPRFAGAVGGVAQWDITATSSYAPGDISKVAWSTATNDIKWATGGVSRTGGVSASIPVVTRLEVGSAYGGLYQFDGTVGGIYGWTSNKSQSELNAVTA